MNEQTDKRFTSSGIRNSSLTRVRPFFGPLLAADPTGSSWLPALLEACPLADRLPSTVLRSPGVLEEELSLTRSYPDKILGRIDLVRAFEHQVAPPISLIRHLLHNPELLRWPTSGGRKRQYSEETRLKREALIEGTAEERAALVGAACDQLRREGLPKRKPTPWWMFEGLTEVDCYLATERVVLLIEGKRKDDLAESTSWVPGRNQLVRNLEAARALAGDRACGVVLAVEKETAEPTDDVLDRGLPHLDDAERIDVRSRFLGQVTWKTLCEALGLDYSSLPDRLEVDKETIDQYTRTVITVEVDEAWVDARRAAISANGPLFVVTAWNPGLRRMSLQENRARNKDLERRLLECDIPMWEALGASPDGHHAEESYAVAGISPARALEIGREFGQAAIFQVTATDSWVLGCDGSWERRASCA